MNDDNKDSDDSPSDKPKSKRKIEKIRAQNIHARQKTMYDISPKQQKEMAQDMFAQMKQLKADNEAMGYHGYSTDYLQRHHSVHSITSAGSLDTETETDIDTPLAHPTSKYHHIPALTVQSSNDATDNPFKQMLATMQPHTAHSHKSSVILSETQGLKHKLEIISSSINKIRQDLHNNEYKNNDQQQLNQLIMSFQNQLTHIQDQIEDAENDIESHIDVKFIKYMEDIKLNKQKIKNMKKEKKDKEKQQQMNKEKEQQRIIEIQRLQIEKLIAQSQGLDASPQPQPLPLPAQNVNRRNKLRPRRQSLHSIATVPVPLHEEEFVYGDESEDVYSFDEMEYLNPNVFIPGGGRPLNQSPMEGTYQSQGYVQQQSRGATLLSDNAIKIVGGVVIVLAGLYVIGRYLSNRSQRNMAPGPGVRRARMKYS